MESLPAGTSIFREEQYFRQVWIWALLVIVAASLIIPFGMGMIEQLIHGRPMGNHPLPDGALIVVGSLMILMGIGLLWLFYAMKLVTEVREDAIYIRFLPLAKETVYFSDIAKCEARTYRPILEYGGWGIRRGRRGKAYNVSGNRGVQLQLKNGRGLLIGSQRAEELALVIQSRINA